MKQASSERNARPPSMGKAGSRLKITSMMFASNTRSTSDPWVIASFPNGTHVFANARKIKRMMDMTMLTAGPATATTN